MKNPIGPRASVTMGGNYYFCTSCKSKHNKLSKIGKKHKVYAWPNQQHLLNPGTNWHKEQAKIWKQASREAGAEGNTAAAYNFAGHYGAHLHSIRESEKLGLKNPRRRRRNPDKSILPILVLGTVVVLAIGYFGRRASV